MLQTLLKRRRTTRARGDPGTGKTAIVEGLAQHRSGDVPSRFARVVC